MENLLRGLGFVLLGVFVFLVAHHMISGTGDSPGLVWVYVHNSGSSPIDIFIDDDEVRTLPGGEHESYELLSGTRRFSILRGRDKLMDDDLKLEKAEFLRDRKYFVNPDKRACYLTYKVAYGSSLLKDMLDATKGNNSPRDRNNETAEIFKELIGKIELMPEQWFEMNDVDYVLVSPPEMILTRGGSDIRGVITQVSPSDYDFLQRAKSNENPSEYQLKKLIEVLERNVELCI